MSSGLVGPLDSELATFLGTLPTVDAPVGLDLSTLTFIEPSSLIVLLAIYGDRKRTDRPTTIKFPTAYPVRRILGRWKFLDALKIVGHPSVPMATPGDAGRLSTLDNLESELEKNYLPIKVICGATNEERPSNQHVDDELERSNATLMMAWLQSHLKPQPGVNHDEWRNLVKDTFPSRIVFEAMMNSVRHPQATRIVTTSHIQWKHQAPHDQNPVREPEEGPVANDPDEGTFTSVWWDDGRGIVETLREVIDSGKSIVSSALPLPEKQCAVKFEDALGHRISDTKLTTNYVPDNRSSNAELLFASMCSRITRDPEGKGHRTMLADDVPTDSPLRQPGMGLYILVDCAINIFGGSVSFRTGNLFMNVKRGNKKGPRKADYSVSISCPSESFRFPGNMLTVRLPIVRDSDKLEGTK